MNFSWLSVCLKSGSHNGLSGICRWVHWEENFAALRNGTKLGKTKPEPYGFLSCSHCAFPQPSSAPLGWMAIPSPATHASPSPCNGHRPRRGPEASSSASLETNAQERTRSQHREGPWFGPHVTQPCYTLSGGRIFLRPIWWLSLMRKNPYEIKEGLWVSEHEAS